MGVPRIQILAAVVILPCIPPLDLRPFFPGPDPSSKLSTHSDVPQLRSPKFTKQRGGTAGDRLSVIRGSVIRSDAEDVLTMDEETRTRRMRREEDMMLNFCMLIVSSLLLRSNENEDDDDRENDEKSIERGIKLTAPPKAKGASLHSTPTHTSQFTSTTISPSGSANSAATTGDSFITRRWDRDAALALSLSLSPTKFRERKHRFFSPNSSSFITNLTPTFWAFWLGFLFPCVMTTTSLSGDEDVDLDRETE